MSKKFAGSWELQELSLAERFFEYSDAYLDGAETITRELIAADKADDFLRGSTAIYLARHAVELFLKGALLQANSKASVGHSLETLARQFESSFPGPKYKWSIPFRTQVIGLDGQDAAAVIKKSDESHPGDQIARYPADKSFQPWEGVIAFNGKQFGKTIDQTRSDFVRLRAAFSGGQSEAQRNAAGNV